MFHDSPLPFPARSLEAHKGSVGTVLAVAGSRGMTGAAFLCGKAALRTGAGLVTLACPEGSNHVLEVKTTCVMTRPLPETETGSLARSALEPLCQLLPGKSALAVGPGLSQHPETVELVRGLLGKLAESTTPLVLDADGLNAFAGKRELLKPLGNRLVLTPHPGEFLRLSDCGQARLTTDRRQCLVELAQELGAVVVLKGHRTLVARGAEVYENENGNPGLATGGTGDVLTGVIAALLAAGLSAWDAARLGVFVHGKAGDAAARRQGWAGLIATDLLEALPEAIRPLEVHQ